jgi:hypothetical protein
MGFLLLMFQAIKRHYVKLSSKLKVEEREPIPTIRTVTLLLVPRVHKGILQAIAYARQTSPDCRAIHVALNIDGTEQVKSAWLNHAEDIPLIILDSPYRSIVDPITDYIDTMLERDKKLVVTVIVPQAVPANWFQGLLHNNAATLLKHTLGQRNNVVITNIRYHL